MKHLVMKKPAKHLNPTKRIDNKTFKLHLCSHKSYITTKCETTNKWPLVIESVKPDHQEVMTRIWSQMADMPDLSKQAFIEKRNTCNLENDRSPSLGVHPSDISDNSPSLGPFQ